MPSSELEFLAPEYNVPTFVEVFDSPESFDEFCTDTGILEPEITSAFLQKTWFMLYVKYGNNPIASADITQWKYSVVVKLNAYAPTYIKKDEIQKALRALNLDELREGYKSVFNHAVNPSTKPSTDDTEELPFINDQNVNKTKKNKVDSYLSLWESLRSNIMDEFISKFAPLFSKILSTTDRLVYIDEV